jgi:hypothetical protein
MTTFQDYFEDYQFLHQQNISPLLPVEFASEQDFVDLFKDDPSSSGETKRVYEELKTRPINVLSSDLVSNALTFAGLNTFFF